MVRSALEIASAQSGEHEIRPLPGERAQSGHKPFPQKEQRATASDAV
jgi:hypothetical protein